jgi:hypothetical protein
VLFWPNFFKRNGVKFWLKFVERFASPKPTGKYPVGASPQQIKQLQEALIALSEDNEVAIPEGMLIEYLEAAQTGTIDSYESLCSFMDAQISRAVLGETGTTDQSGSGGSRARDEVGNEVRLEIAKSVADSLSFTFNRLAAWITEYNVPGAIAPKIWRSFDEQEDLNGRSARDKTLFDLGYRLNQETVTSIYGEGYEQVGEETEEVALYATLGPTGVQALTGILTQAATGQLPKDNAIAVLEAIFGIEKELATRIVPDSPQDAAGQGLQDLFGGEGTAEKEEAPAAFAETEIDGADQVADKARSPIEAAIAPWLATIREFVESAATLEEIRDGLVDLHPQLSRVEFAEAMGQAMMLADLAGQGEVVDEDEIEFAEGTKPKCNPAKSHFCQTPGGRGSCVPLSKKCKYTPNPTEKKAADWVEKKVAPAKEKATPAKKKATPAKEKATPAGVTASESLKTAIAEKDFDQAIELADQIYEAAKKRAPSLRDFEQGIQQNNAGYNDYILEHLNAELGYDALPDVVNAAKMKKYLDGGETAIYRGFGSSPERFEKHFESFKTGKLYAAHGMYGHGTYVAMALGETEQDRAIAFEAAASYGSGVMEMSIKKGSNVVSAGDAIETSRQLREGMANAAEAKRKTLKGKELEQFEEKFERAETVLYGDEGPPSGRLGVLSGWDAIALSGVAYSDNYMLLLNRGATRVKNQ